MGQFWSDVGSNVVAAVLIGGFALVFKEPLKRWWSDRTSVNQQFFRWIRRQVKLKGRERFSVRCQILRRHVWVYQQGRPDPGATAEWLELNPYIVDRCSRCGEHRITPRDDGHAAS